MSIKIFTMASDPSNVGLGQLTASAARWGWEYDVFYFDGTTRSKVGVARHKMALLEHVLSEISRSGHEYVAVLDGYDMIVNNSPEECVRRMEDPSVDRGALIVGYSSPVLLNTFRIHRPITAWTRFRNRTDDTFASSESCGQLTVNLGMVMGRREVVSTYIRDMLGLWATNQSMCTEAVCSEQKYFKIMMDDNRYSCANRTLFIDTRGVFVKNHRSQFDKLTKRFFNNAVLEEADIDVPVFHHFPGNTRYARGQRIQTHYFNLTMGATECDPGTDCPICACDRTLTKIRIITGVLLCVTALMLFTKRFLF